MPITIERGAFDAEQGFQYYVSFKPALPGTQVREDACASVSVEAQLAVSETGELADCSFVLPKPCRSEQALTFIRRQEEAHITPPQVHIAMDGPPADAVATALATLELDVAGRIIGMAIRWIPDIATN